MNKWEDFSGILSNNASLNPGIISFNHASEDILDNLEKKQGRFENFGGVRRGK